MYDILLIGGGTACI